MEATLEYRSFHWGATLKGHHSNLQQIDKSLGQNL